METGGTLRGGDPDISGMGPLALGYALFLPDRRKKMRNKTMIISAAIAIPSVLAAMVSWSVLDLPRPASNHEIQAVQQYAGSTREIVLNQEWFRYDSQLSRATAELARDPTNQRLIEEVSRLRLALRNVEQQLQEVQ